MKHNIICIPFAYKERANAGANVSKSTNNTTDIYLKNAAVALCSAKLHNQDCDVVFATNMKNIPQTFIDLLNKYKVRIEYVPFDKFVFPDSYPWSLAFYKLCVLDYFSNQDFDNFCYMDTDVYVQDTFKYIWQECSSKLMLYDINHGLQVEGYRKFCEEVASFMKNSALLITHYGGEFYAGNHHDTELFIEAARRIYNEMRSNEYVTHKGDEFILSLAAYQTPVNVKNAGAYIHRFWTGPSFRLISTCYRNNMVSVLHLPAEKEHGILKLFDLLIKGKLDNIDIKKVWKICRLYDSSIYMKVLEHIASYRKN